MTNKKLNKAEQYIDDVLNDRIIVCKYVKLAVKRNINDLDTCINKGLYFDRKAAQRALKFFPFLKHTKGKQFSGKPFELEPWQAFIIWCVFGWKNESDNTRRFTDVYIDVAKKNGKTAKAAGIALYMLIADNEDGAEVYTAATKKEQAKICFNQAREMVKKSSALSGKLTVYQHNLHSEITFSKMEALAADSDKLDGVNPHCAIIDEYHAHKTSELSDNLRSAMAAREQPLLFTITTAGFNKEGPCFKKRKTCIDVLNGILVDETLFTIIFTLDEGDEWDDPKVWIKANPNLGISVSEKFIRDEINSAKNNPTREVSVKTKNLNIWTDASNVWIPDARWQECNLMPYPNLTGKECYGALDLASTRDLVCWGKLIPDIYDNQEIFHYMPIFFCPKLTAIERIRKDNVNYDVWIRQGLIIETEGDVTDYRFIMKYILDDMEKYNIEMIEYDRYNSSQLVIDLTQQNVPMEPFGQGFISMSTPTKMIEEVVYKKALNHAGNPVMRWQNGNVEIVRDPADNIKIDKARSIEKVDGMVTLAMCFGGYLTNQQNKKVDLNKLWANRGI